MFWLQAAVCPPGGRLLPLSPAAPGAPGHGVAAKREPRAARGDHGEGDPGGGELGHGEGEAGAPRLDGNDRRGCTDALRDRGPQVGARGPVLERLRPGDHAPQLRQRGGALGAAGEVRGERLALGRRQRPVEVLREAGSPVVGHRATPSSLISPDASAAPCARGAIATSTCRRRCRATRRSLRAGTRRRRATGTPLWPRPAGGRWPARSPSSSPASRPAPRPHPTCRGRCPAAPAPPPAPCGGRGSGSPPGGAARFRTRPRRGTSPASAMRGRTHPASGRPPDPRPSYGGTDCGSGTGESGTAARTRERRRSPPGRRPLLPTRPPPMLDPCAVSPPRGSCTQLDRWPRSKVVKDLDPDALQAAEIIRLVGVLVAVVDPRWNAPRHQLQQDRHFNYNRNSDGQPYVVGHP